jgi:hypothetical protein
MLEGVPLPRRAWIWAILAGIAGGIAYTLSPALVWFAALLPLVFIWALRGLTGRERRWVLAILIASVAVRLLILAAFFLHVDHSATPFGVLIPDEWFLKTRSLWIRDVALGIPVAPSDWTDFYGNYGKTSFLWVLATMYLALGPSPYAAHLLNLTMYLVGAIALYRCARVTFGALPAIGGLLFVLCMPTLFVWSISALKEPSHFFLASIATVSAVGLVRSKTWLERAFCAAVVLLSLAGLETLRSVSLAIAGGGIVAGMIATVMTRRAWLAVAGGFVLAVALVVGLRRPSVQAELMDRFRIAAITHLGHVNTTGYAYKLLDPYFYTRFNDNNVRYMTREDAMRFAVRAAISFVTVPLPWQMQSTAALALLPQQILWYISVFAAFIGLIAGFRRDPLLTMILACNIAIGWVAISLHNGNIGTLVRIRDMVVPFVGWLASLGVCAAIERALAAAQRGAERSPVAVGGIARQHALDSL